MKIIEKFQIQRQQLIPILEADETIEANEDDGKVSNSNLEANTYETTKANEDDEHKIKESRA